MFTFPSERKRPAERLKWQKLINRSSPRRSGKLWTIGSKQRICSQHFIDGEPTEENPYPTLNLGYHSSPRAKQVLNVPKRRKLSYGDISISQSSSLPEADISSASIGTTIETAVETSLLSPLSPVEVSTPCQQVPDYCTVISELNEKIEDMNVEHQVDLLLLQNNKDNIIAELQEKKKKVA